MIVAAGLWVLVGLGLFVAGVLTDRTALYWACVGACTVAAALLFVARRRLRTPAPVAPAQADTGRHAGSGAGSRAGEPGTEEVEVADLLLVVDLRDEVQVVDEYPRYHVAGCRHLVGQEPIPIPLDQARTDGFTPCGSCRPDATLAGRVRGQRDAASS